MNLEDEQRVRQIIKESDSGGCLIIFQIFFGLVLILALAYGKTDDRWRFLGASGIRPATIWLYDQGQVRREKALRYQDFWFTWGGGLHYQSEDGIWHEFHGPHQVVEDAR